MEFDISLLEWIVTTVLYVKALIVEFLRGLIPNKGFSIKSCLLFLSALFDLLLRGVALTKEHFLHLVHQAN